MPPQNRAAWLMKKKDSVLVVNEAPYNKPESDELVIKIMAVAINPADVMIQKLGIIVDTYPAILGCDVAGNVEEIGSGITDFKQGDRVIGAAQPRPGGIYKYSGFQQYVVLKMPHIAKIPENASFSDATVLPLGINTAASCLFMEGTLGLEMPPGQGGNGKTLLIWGASSSIGSCGVQLAVAAGYEVFGVASKKNHAFVKSLGAAQVFDQSDLNVVDDIAAALEGNFSVGAYDAISKKETLYPICEILNKSGGKKLIAAVAPGAEKYAQHDVTITTNLAHIGSFPPVGQQIWRVFLEPALASGAIQYKPSADIAGHGLEDIQKGCDLAAEGFIRDCVVV